jgi:cytochrome P450
MEPRRLPADWATDFDQFDAAYLEDPYSTWSAMRTECPVARTTRRGGAVLPVRHEEITRIAHDPETFSSRVLEATGPVPPPGRELKMPPITSDPPEHNGQRRVLLPLFTKPRIRELEAITRAKATALIDAIAGRTGAGWWQSQGSWTPRSRSFCAPTPPLRSAAPRRSRRPWGMSRCRRAGASAG